MKITIVGLPGTKTQRTIINVQEAATDFGHHLSVDWISNARTMCAMGVVHTPSILVDGKLKSSGRIPSVYEISQWVEAELVDDRITATGTSVSF